MSLIQLLKFSEVETGLYKIPHFETPRFQMGVFETGVTVASGLYLHSVRFSRFFDTHGNPEGGLIVEI